MLAESTRIEELRRRVDLDPASVSFAALAEEYRRAGRFDEAIATCRAGLERHPEYISARVTLGRTLMDTGALSEARAEFEQVVKAAPENLAAIRGLAEIHKRTSEMDPQPVAATAPPKSVVPAAAPETPVEGYGACRWIRCRGRRARELPLGGPQSSRQPLKSRRQPPQLSYAHWMIVGAAAPHLVRLARLRADLGGVALDALVVSHLPNIRYLTSFRGTAGTLVVLPQRALSGRGFPVRERGARGGGVGGAVRPRGRRGYRSRDRAWTRRSSACCARAPRRGSAWKGSGCRSPGSTSWQGPSRREPPHPG